MARQPNASYEGSGQRQALGVQEALNKITALQTQIGEIQSELNELENALQGKASLEHNHDERYYTETEIDNKLGGKANTNAPTIINPTLRFLLKDETVNAELRRSGSSGQYGLSIVYTDEEDNTSFYNLVNHLGERQFPPLDHASTEWTYGPGTSTEYGHCRIIDNLNTAENHSGYALSAHQGYVIDQKIGAVQILNVTRINCTTSTFANDGSTWSNVKGTFSSVPGASGYYFIPISCNFGFVTSVSISGTTVTCTAINASGGSHSCTIVGYVIAYKNV